MSLDITPQDIIIDETTGLQQPSDIDPTGNSNPTLLYLESLGTPLEVAYQADFVTATASAGETINSVSLTQNASGTPFSTTVGVNSGVMTVDGNYVWLFQAVGHPNVVIGVIGTSNPLVAPSAGGQLAFSFGLDGGGTSPDLYLVQYVPLFNPDSSNPDDRIDLANKVFASVSGSTVVNFSQLGDAPPGHNNWYILDADVASTQKILVTAHDNGVQSEVNVSTQGLGVSSQDVRYGRELQIDLINGGTQSAGKNFTNSPLAPNYTDHIENVSGAGFSISQSTPTNTVADIEVHAYNNDDNAKGGALPGDDNDTEINITGATFKLNGVVTTAAALGITVDLNGTGMILHNVGEGVTVDFTTAGGSGGTFDRFTIKNVDTQKDYFDVKEVHFGGESTNAYTEQVGSFINFDDDGPAVTADGTVPTLTTDDTNIPDTDSASFASVFSTDPGADGLDAVTYALGVKSAAVDSGVDDTLSGDNILLRLNGNGEVEGYLENDTGTVAFVISVDENTGEVTLTQNRAVVHNDPTDPVESGASAATLAAADLVTLTATAADGDGDTAHDTANIGTAFTFEDDGPTVTADGTIPTLTTDDTDISDASSTSFAAAFNTDLGADGGTVAYELDVKSAGADSGLDDTLSGDNILLRLNGNGEVEGYLQNDTATVVFVISVDQNTGEVTLTQNRAVVHNDPTDPVESGASAATLAAADLVTLTATATDGDGDTAHDTANIGTAFAFEDDGPTITKPFDGDQNNLAGNPLIGTHEILTNLTGQQAIGDFGYDIGSDQFAAYDATHSDFVDQDAVAAGVQLSLGGNLTGLIPGTPTSFISSFATLQSESANLATFNWQISYDSDPNTAGDQTATAGGTLVFSKGDGTYTITLNDAVEGFTKDILHTSELLSKLPTSNTGHPNIVVEKLFESDSTPETTDRDFFVQFTANSTTNTIKFGLNTTGDSDGANATPSDTAWNPGDLVTNSHEDWVSATQSTNGVAGDTIQKGELLTLRFFDTSPGIATESITPSQTAADMAIKFDGIGSSEDLMVILDLVSATDSSLHTSKAIYVQNGDIYKAGQVPTAYAADFPLDNNDGLVIIEKNDYNGAGENWVIEGAQIMQSGNGITGDGTAIDLNRATGTGSTGSSSQTALVNWDATDNDVLKIVDLGFTSTQTTTPDAHLDFGVQLHDADGDATTIQHIFVDIA